MGAVFAAQAGAEREELRCTGARALNDWLGKAIALESTLPIGAVPTTYAGSEMTPIDSLTNGSLERTGRDMRVLPRTVIYDASRTLSLPANVSAVSGVNAIAHAVEAPYLEDANPVISLMAEEVIRMLCSTWLAGFCVGAVGMALHQKLCHTLGGTFNLPHAQTHAAMLPHTTITMRRPMRLLSNVLHKDAADARPLLFGLNRPPGVPISLAQIGAGTRTR